jgi:hypothetical protein
MRTFWVYILTNQNRSVLYVGMTNSLESDFIIIGTVDRSHSRNDTGSTALFIMSNTIRLVTRFPERNKSRAGPANAKMNWSTA